ncbi:hypothetical protein EW026_g8305 [Hermanssonia centrifuga]|uniref:Uncharacterized protein n=1 Tax=Hermanssonia centrifuga TaxID=98765 RepID=A0A4S4K4M7_9APHY|nr:hypothetical protein EW026_g8305 [Hermanssonia centrifuga]
MPRTATLVPQDGGSHGVDATGQITRVPYLSFIADVRRNSRFHDLTEEQLLELGGVEYRALNTLLWVVPLVVGAWANTGMSLVDQNMVPFQTAYLMIAVLIICVLAGNTAFPIFLRFMIVVSFVGDLVLNINNPATDAIPVGTRIALAFLSAAAVRNAGFQGVAASSLTPAAQVLYVIMMYISIYPIALSVRATNVYEENSLGIYRPNATEEDHQHMPDATEKRVAIWGIYLMRHARKQLSFDMWWLAFSLFLICIIERDGLENPEKPWFNVFALIFELVSAYGTVGLSLGLPTANYSLSGEFHTLSKLITCAVMLRGRHRGLPIALDRAVLLPYEFIKRTEGGRHSRSADHTEPITAQEAVHVEDIEVGGEKDVTDIA